MSQTPSCREGAKSPTAVALLHGKGCSWRQGRAAREETAAKRRRRRGPAKQGFFRLISTDTLPHSPRHAAGRCHPLPRHPAAPNPGRAIGCLRGNRPELVRTLPVSLRPGRSYLVGEAKIRGGGGEGGVTGTGRRQLCRAAEGESWRGRREAGRENAGPGSCAAAGASRRGCGGRNRHRKLQTLPNAPAIRAEGGGRVGRGVSPRHPSKERERAQRRSAPDPRGHPRAAGEARGRQQVLRRSGRRSPHRHAGARERRGERAGRWRSRTAPSLPLATLQRPAGRGSASAALPLRSVRRAARPWTPPEPSRRSAEARSVQGQRDALSAAAVLTCARRSGTADPRGLRGLRRGSRSPSPPAPRVSGAPGPGDRPPPRAPWSARSPAPPTRRRRGHPMGAAPAGTAHWLGRLSLSPTAAINGAVSQRPPSAAAAGAGNGGGVLECRFRQRVPFFGVAFGGLWLRKSPG